MLNEERFLSTINNTVLLLLLLHGMYVYHIPTSTSVA